MKKYEIMYILNASLTEEERVALQEKLHATLTSNGDTIEVNEKDWGLRELAYPINFQTNGYYVVVSVEAKDDNGVKEFKRLCKIDTNVLREMVITL
ncbi:MAG: 30S ribosomal protein S6 [Candidatus Caccosoma sp.]|nr:30S ribosomal protein S6 [Candidatus Caccosoma sp.]